MKKIVLSVMAVLFASLNYAAEAQDPLLSLPDGAVIEDWTMSYRNTNPNNTAQYTDETDEVKVAFSGNNIFIQGLAPTEAWLAGTIDGNKATFAARQYLGTAQGYNFYLIGYEGNGAIDVVFNYNAESGTLSTDANILLINEQDQALMQLSNIYLSKKGTGGPVVDDDELVALPLNCTPQEYVFKATQINYNPDGSVGDMTPVEWLVNVAFNGTKEVYIQGVYEMLPDAWIKGTVDEDVVTFAKNQYLGKAAIYKVFFTGLLTNAMSDAEFQLSDGQLSSGSYYVAINSSKTSLAPFAVYAGITISKLEVVAATPATPSIEYYQPYSAAEGYAMLNINIPAKDVDGKAISAEHLGYSLYTQKGTDQKIYTFKKSMYQNLPSDESTVIPYLFDDNYDFRARGVQVFINEDFGVYDKIGVQSVYTVNEDIRRSEISWFAMDTRGISAPAGQDVAGESYFDMQGRKAQASSKGLLVKQVRTSDGSVKTMKVLRK